MDKITLDYPVELAPHHKVSELVMRRPKAKDELQAKKLEHRAFNRTHIPLP